MRLWLAKLLAAATGLLILALAALFAWLQNRPWQTAGRRSGKGVSMGRGQSGCSRNLEGLMGHRSMLQP
jgi:hypothetical protein